MKKYFWQIAKWSCVGLLVRLILMPFTMFSQDLLYINYLPMMFVKDGIWDPYSFSHFPNVYYGPVLFLIISATNLIFIKLFNATSLVKILEISGPMMFQQFTTIDYVDALSGLNLFKNLFLMKSPYLIFDFLIAGILLKLSMSRRTALVSYKFWMLNIVVLHTAYMIGQFELIPAFFVIIALFAALRKRPYVSVVYLCLGGATKLFPYVLILPTCLLLGQNWRKRFELLFIAGVVTIALYLPFYLSSGSSVLSSFSLFQLRQYSGIAKWILTGAFLGLYSFVSINAVKDSKGPEPEKKLLFYFLVIGFLTYTTSPITFRYFVFITPLLALVLPQNKKFTIFILLIIFMLAFLRLPSRYLQFGLFAPLNPDYFMSLPTIQEVIGRLINIEIIYKVMARLLLLCFFIAAWWMWRSRLNTELGAS